MAFKNLKLLIGLAAVSLLASACSITTTSSVSSSGQPTNDDSVFLSVNSGDTWRPMVAVPTVNGQAQNIANINVNVMAVDPEDNLAVYLASFDQGLFYTYNVVSQGWTSVTSLPIATVNDVKVDPHNKCLIYAAVANSLYRSADCTRSWTQIYVDNNSGVTVNTIAVDQYNNHNLYIGTSRGEIIKSIDSGASWRTIQRLSAGVAKLLISPQDSRLIFVATTQNNIYSFTSSTDTNPADSANIDQNFLVENWSDLNAVLKDYNVGTSFKDLIIAPSNGALFLATDKAILRSPDNGITWENIKLIQPDKDAVINAIAVDPQNSAHIYYVTNTTFFRSTDGGVTWTTKSLPTKRAGRQLMVDFNNPTVIYLGTVKLKN